MKHHLLYDWKDNEFRIITDVFEPSTPVQRRKSVKELEQERLDKEIQEEDEYMARLREEFAEFGVDIDD